MDEGTGKAIPLRRSRNGTRALVTRTNGWTAGVAARVLRALEPPRQVWLVGLGSTALTVRGARELWTRLVAEGAAAESWLRGALWSRRG